MNSRMDHPNTTCSMTTEIQKVTITAEYFIYLTHGRILHLPDTRSYFAVRCDVLPMHWDKSLLTLPPASL